MEKKFIIAELKIILTALKSIKNGIKVAFSDIQKQYKEAGLSVKDFNDSLRAIFKGYIVPDFNKYNAGARAFAALKSHKLGLAPHEVDNALSWMLEKLVEESKTGKGSLFFSVFSEANKALLIIKDFIKKSKGSISNEELKSLIKKDNKLSSNPEIQSIELALSKFKKVEEEDLGEVFKRLYENVFLRYMPSHYVREQPVETSGLSTKARRVMYRLKKLLEKSKKDYITEKDLAEDIKKTEIVKELFKGKTQITFDDIKDYESKFSIEELEGDITPEKTESPYEAKQLQEALERYIKKMSPQHVPLFNMILEGKPISEIAESLTKTDIKEKDVTEGLRALTDSIIEHLGHYTKETHNKELIDVVKSKAFNNIVFFLEDLPPSEKHNIKNFLEAHMKDTPHIDKIIDDVLKGHPARFLSKYILPEQMSTREVNRQIKDLQKLIKEYSKKEGLSLEEMYETFKGTSPAYKYIPAPKESSIAKSCVYLVELLERMVKQSK